MPTNNTALFDSVVAGIASSNQAWLFDPLSADYSGQANVAAAIATEVDAQIPVIPTGATLSQRNLLASIAKGVMAGREPQSLTPADYLSVANAIAAMFTQMNTKLQNSNAGTVPAFTTTQQIFVSAHYGNNVTGDGSQNNPYATIAFAQSKITDASAAKVYQIILLPGTYAENIALKAFTEIVGSDPTEIENDVYPILLTGNVTLGPSFVGAIAGTLAWMTNVEIDGTTTLDFQAAGATSNTISFTNCQVGGATSLILTDNSIEYHNCIIIEAFTQLGGSVNWYNTIGTPPFGTLMHVEAIAGFSAAFNGFSGCWQANFTADQNGVGGGPNVIVQLTNFTITGTVTIIATAVDSPVINGDYGSLPENTVLVGAGSHLSHQMRVSEGHIVPAGTAIAATSVTTVAVPITAALLGTTGIESLISQCSIIAANWTDILITNKCNVTFQFVNPGTINVLINNPGAGFNTAADAAFTYFGYLR